MNSQTQAASPSSPQQSAELVVRETVESLAVAFILALLFKAFVAEAFVIPTGSMAPTLMGAHKDIVSKESGYRFQVSASQEFNSENAEPTGKRVVGAICPISRQAQSIDPSADPNEATFSGDRILVSKLAYVWNSPKRWDVIVFKFIERARQNYIKRCVGLPGETIRVKEGDIFVRSQTSGPFEIARKPPHVMNSMMQIVNDTKFVPESFAKGGVPCPWQPQDDSGVWKSDWRSGTWAASAKQSSDQVSYLRYYHRVLDSVALDVLNNTGALPAPLDSRQLRLITDFAHYNAHIENSSYSRVDNDGIHWVGDLASEFDFETTNGTKSISLLIVESGFRHTITIDLATGLATAEVDFEGEKIPAFEDGGSGTYIAKAATTLRAGRKHTVKVANFDDQLTLWVDGKVVDWNPTSRLRCMNYVSPAQKGPRTSESDPLDGAPLGFGISSGSVNLTRVKVFRDIYYIAHPVPRPGTSIIDYPNYWQSLRESVTPQAMAEYARKMHNSSVEELRSKLGNDIFERNVVATNPNLWGQGPLTSARAMYEYKMENDWYFPLGDNSAQSSDARSWAKHHTPARLMIGRAVVVFWPHYWNAPIKFLPNFQRMGLIR